jgi:hypothetical protein
MVGWWLVDGWSHCLVGWVVCSLVAKLAGWFAGCWVIGLLMGSLDGSLLGHWLFGRSVDRMVFQLFVRSDGQ